MSDNRDFIYTIPEKVLLDLALDANDLYVYAVIRSYDFQIDRERLADMIEINLMDVDASIAKLKKAGHIKEGK